MTVNSVACLSALMVRVFLASPRSVSGEHCSEWSVGSELPGPSQSEAPRPETGGCHPAELEELRPVVGQGCCPGQQNGRADLAGKNSAGILRDLENVVASVAYVFKNLMEVS